MKIAMSGVSGFVGSNLQKVFEATGCDIVSLGKNEFALSDESFCEKLAGCDTVINLAGAPIISRWSEEYKKLLVSSRIDTTAKIVRCINSMQKKPKLLISASASGIYKDGGLYGEDDAVGFGCDFLANLCGQWEAEALKAQSESVRVVVFRFGIVLGNGGGALAQMTPLFKLGLGGIIGSGKQGFSWIHIDDLKNAFKFAVENENMQGIYNLVAPNPTTNKGLTRAIGAALHRPTLLTVPTFALKLIYSEGAKVLTDGQTVIPKRLMEAGFVFSHSHIREAISSLKL